MARAAAMLALGVHVLGGSAPCPAQSALTDARDVALGGTTRFIVDGNRMYAELGFRRPDGSTHRALAFVDMGSPSMMLTEALYNELQLDQRKPLVFSVGALNIEVPLPQIDSERSRPHSIGSDLQVEAVLPAGVLQRYAVAIDYRGHTLALAPSTTSTPEGVPVPFRINQRTGLIAVDASVDGKSFPITIDNGSAYSWIRDSTAKRWLSSHPDWERGAGAVGASNMMMSGDGTETSGTLLRLPEIALGALVLKHVGVLGAGPSKRFAGNLDLFDWYSQKNAVPVIGWIGGNVLKSFRLTIDYPNRISYWLRQSESDTHELDQVGLTLRSAGRVYVVAAIATKNHQPAVSGVLPGDTLLRVGDLDLATASWGAIYRAMHGHPGDARTLVLERNGQRRSVVARVTAF